MKRFGLVLLGEVQREFWYSSMGQRQLGQEEQHERSRSDIRKNFPVLKLEEDSEETVVLCNQRFFGAG